MIDYQATRDTIETGDVIFIQGHSIYSKITKGLQYIEGFDTYSTTHSGIAVWLSGRLFLAEMDGKYNVLRPMSVYSKDILYIHKPKTKSRPVEELFTILVDTTYHYDIKDFLSIAIHKLFGFYLKDDKNAIVCSEYCAKWLELCGYKFNTTLMSPSKLHTTLLYITK